MTKQIASDRIELLALATADNGAPTANDGIALPGHRAESKNAIELVATAGGAFVFDAYVWGKSGSIWVRELFNTTFADIGHINEGVQFSGGAGGIIFRRVFSDLGYLDRIYFEVLNFDGTNILATLIPIEE